MTKIILNVKKDLQMHKEIFSSILEMVELEVQITIMVQILDQMEVLITMEVAWVHLHSMIICQVMTIMAKFLKCTYYSVLGLKIHKLLNESQLCWTKFVCDYPCLKLFREIR